MGKSIRIMGMHVRKSLEEPRVWAVFFLVFIEALIKSSEMRAAAEASGYGINALALLPVIYGGQIGFPRIVSMFGAVFLFSNAPFMDRNQRFLFMRAKKAGWNLGTLLYIPAFSFLYTLVLWLGALAGMFPYIGWSDEWGALLERLSLNSGLAGLIIDDGMMIKYSVFQAFLLEFALLWLSSVLIGSASYLAGLFLSGKAGIAIGSLFVILDGISLCLPQEMLVALFYISPVSLLQIWCLDTDGSNYYPTPSYAVGFLAGLCIFTGILCIIAFPKLNIDSREEHDRD